MMRRPVPVFGGVEARWSEMDPAVRGVMIVLGLGILTYAGILVLRPQR